MGGGDVTQGERNIRFGVLAALLAPPPLLAVEIVDRPD
jgi:hypothetical protein